MADGIAKVADALIRKKQSFQGTSPQTRAALVQSGAMHPDDFKDDPTPEAAPVSAPSTKFYTPPGKTPAQQAADKAAADAAYQKYKDQPRRR